MDRLSVGLTLRFYYSILLGLLNNYLPNIPDSKKELLDALLWGLKLEGCAISEKEIRLIIKLGKSKLK